MQHHNVMEFKLECFELSGLTFATQSNVDGSEVLRDYQLKIISDDGAFSSSWMQGISDIDCRHMGWPDDICLECDPPLVGIPMKFEVVIQDPTNTGGASMLHGDLVESMWDSVIDVIIGAANSRDVVTKRHPDSALVTATTIVGVPMHVIDSTGSSSLPRIGDHSVTLFITISITAIPLEEGVDDPTPLASPHTADPGRDIAHLVPHEVAEEAHPPAAGSAVDIEPPTEAPASSSESPPPISRETSEESLLGPEIVDIVASTESIRPFAPPPPPPPPQAQSQPQRSAVAPSPPPPPTSAAPPPPPPRAIAPSPPPPMISAAPPPPPPANAAAAAAVVPPPPQPRAQQPPPPPVAAKTAPPPPPPAAPASTLNSDAALSKAHAPSNRHGRARSSFVFVPSPLEDTLGIRVEAVPVPVQEVPTSSALPEAAAAAPAVAAVAGASSVKSAGAVQPIPTSTPGASGVVERGEDVEGVDLECTDVGRLQAMLRRLSAQESELKAALAAASSRSAELEQALNAKDSELQKVRDEHAASAQQSANAAEQLRQALAEKLAAAEAALEARESALQAATQQLESLREQVMSAPAAQPHTPPGHERTRTRISSESSLSLGRSTAGGSLASMLSVAASPSERIALRRESLAAGAVAVPVQDTRRDSAVPASDEPSSATKKPRSSIDSAQVASPKSPSVHIAPGPVFMTTSSVTSMLFGTESSVGGDEDDTEETVRPYDEEGDAVPHHSMVIRPKSFSIKERSQTLSQLDTTQQQLQAMLKAEIDKKTPRERLRHNANAEYELSAPSPITLESAERTQDGSLTPFATDPFPSAAAAPAGSARPAPTREHREKGRERESTAEMSSAAAQAASLVMAGERRQLMMPLSIATRSGDSPSAPALHSLDSLLVPITSSRTERSNSGAGGTYRAERPPSVNSTTSSKSPMPARRALGSMFSNNRRQTRMEGTDSNGPASVGDEEEIANTIRELTASLRFSPAEDRLAGTNAAGDALAMTSPQQNRVLQRMQDRRRSQATDPPAGSKEAATAALQGKLGGGSAHNLVDNLPALVEPSVLAAAQRAQTPSLPDGEQAGSDEQHGAKPLALGRSVSLVVPGTGGIVSGERKMSMQARFGRARFSLTHSRASASGVAPVAGPEEGGSAESKAGSDHADSSRSRSPSADRVSAPRREGVQHSAALPVPPHLLRKAIAAAGHTASAGGTNRLLDRGSADSEDFDAELGELDDAVQSAEEARSGYLHFPLELTQRDYLRRLFEILGDSIRASLLQLLHTTEHVLSGSGAVEGAHGTPFLGSAAPFSHLPHHRHSTGGHAPSTPMAGASFTEAAVLHGGFSWAEAQRYDATALLALLLDRRYNFKLRPYICAKGSSIPSNDAYSAVQKYAEQLLDTHTKYVTALTVASPGHSATTAPDSGHLEVDAGVYKAASALSLALSQAAAMCGHTSVHDTPASAVPLPAVPLAQTLAQLADLELQMSEHAAYKESRMAAAGWKWGDASSATLSMGVHADGTVFAEGEARSSKRASPAGMSVSVQPALTDITVGSAAAARRLSTSPRSSTGSESSLVRGREAKLRTPSPSLRLGSADTKEPGTGGILVHLYRRSEATVAHLLVGVLPSNIAVIELMVCFHEIHELLRIYQEHHRKSGHREEAQFLREFAEALEHQLEMDLSSVGAFKTSQQQMSAAHAALSIASSESASSVGAYFSPATAKVGGDRSSRALSSPDQNSTSPAKLLLTPGASAAEHMRRHGSGRKNGQAVVSTEMLDQIYIELDDMAASIAERESKEAGARSAGAGAMLGGEKTLAAHAAAAVAQKEALLAVKRAAWSFATAPVDVRGDVGLIKQTSALDPVVRIQHKAQSGRYLLEHMRALMGTSDELLVQLEESRAALVAQRNREYADIDREISKEQLRRSQNQEEKIGAVIRELTSLSNQIKHKLAPLHLTHNEELCALLASRGMMAELANKLFSISLTTVNAGHREHVAMCVATLLVRSKSTALVHSVYRNWPQLTITYAVVSAETASYDPAFGNTTALDATTMSVTKLSTPAALSKSMQGGYKAPYSLDFASPTVPRGRPTPVVHTALASPSAGTASVASASRALQPQQQVLQVEYVTQPACEVDVYGTLDFSSTRSLRTLGFTLTQLRQSKCFDMRELLAAGFPLNEVKNLKSSLSVNISAKDLRLAGYTPHECLNVGFDVASLRAGGFDDYSLVRTGLFTSAQLRSVGCDIQRIALMSLFEALDGKHWRHKENWASATQPIGHWYGVHLDGAGHIYKIDLRGNGLKGKLPPALSLLTSLQHLDLYNNLITGGIPEEYAELTALRDLYLGNTGMSIDRAALHAMLPNCKLRL